MNLADRLPFLRIPPPVQWHPAIPPLSQSIKHVEPYFIPLIWLLILKVCVFMPFPNSWAELILHTLMSCCSFIFFALFDCGWVVKHDFNIYFRTVLLVWYCYVLFAVATHLHLFDLLYGDWSFSKSWYNGYPDFHIHGNWYEEVCVDTLIDMFVFWYIILLFFTENFNRVIYCELFCLCYIYVRGKRVALATLEYKSDVHLKITCAYHMVMVKITCASVNYKSTRSCLEAP